MSKQAALGLLAQLVIFLGLLLLGWGLNDLAGFFAHPARAGLFAVALLGSTVVTISSFDVALSHKGHGAGSPQRWVLAMAVAFLLFLGWFLPFGDRWGLLVFPAADAEALRYAGLALYASGGAVRLAAVWTLGQQFSGYVTLQENHQLVQRGLYRLIRHPIYLGALLAFPGAALVFRSWLAIPVFVFVGMFVAARIRREEKLMSEHFGAEFATYRRSTWRLLPYLY